MFLLNFAWHGYTKSAQLNTSLIGPRTSPYTEGQKIDCSRRSHGMSFLSLNLLYNFCENSFKPGEQHLEHLQARLNFTKMLETGNS